MDSKKKVCIIHIPFKSLLVLFCFWFFGLSQCKFYKKFSFVLVIVRMSDYTIDVNRPGNSGYDTAI